MRLIMFALVGLAPMWLQPALACSGPELSGKIKTLAETATAGYAKDPAGDEARKARVQTIIDRYRSLKSSTNGSAIIDTTCREYDELIAVYR
jgi:hypothetical protein